MQIEQSRIRELIPHAGAMCLLDRVDSWNDTHICCVTDSHRRADNPLRLAGRLRAICGVEYAAQAMAVHGALVVQRGGRPRAGSLVSVRDVVCRATELDAQPGELTIIAELLLGNANQMMYAFAVRAGRSDLLTGRATVVLDDGVAPGPAATRHPDVTPGAGAA